MKFGGNITGIPNFRRAIEDVIIETISVVESEAEGGTGGNRITANWRCGEFSSVSSKRGQRKERDASDGDENGFHGNERCAAAQKILTTALRLFFLLESC
jgi:hypothetical protein